MHRGPQAEVMPKTLHGIFAAEECIKLQKDFPFPLFNFYKVLSESFHDLYIMKFFTVFLQDASNSKRTLNFPINNKLTKLGDAIAISKSETIND